MYKSLSVLAGLLLALLVQAAEPPRAPRAETAAESWLKLQASNREASPVPQQQTAKERDQAMQRWLDSYKYPIPDFYRWTKVNSSNN